MSSHVNHIEPEVIPVDKKKILKIWKVAGILAVITGIEFAIALLSGIERGPILITIYIVLTLLKAFYIVAEFMHLGHESKTLIYAIVLPIMFLLWAILAFLMESSAIFNAIFGWYN